MQEEKEIVNTYKNFSSVVVWFSQRGHSLDWDRRNKQNGVILSYGFYLILCHFHIHSFKLHFFWVSFAIVSADPNHATAGDIVNIRNIHNNRVKIEGRCFLCGFFHMWSHHSKLNSQRVATPSWSESPQTAGATRKGGGRGGRTAWSEYQIVCAKRREEWRGDERGEKKARFQERFVSRGETWSNAERMRKKRETLRKLHVSRHLFLPCSLSRRDCQRFRHGPYQTKLTIPNKVVSLACPHKNKNPSIPEYWRLLTKS